MRAADRSYVLSDLERGAISAKVLALPPLTDTLADVLVETRLRVTSNTPPGVLRAGDAHV